MKKLVRLPEAELSVMRAVWRLPAPAPTQLIPGARGFPARVSPHRPHNPRGNV